MIAKKLGIIGGGQLGRMSALAAARLGIQTFIYCPEAGCPASHVSAGTYFAEYDNEEALAEFAGMVDVISYEFENIPVETVTFLQKFKPVYPDERLLQVSQDRTQEKKFLNDIGIPTTPWQAINCAEDIETVQNTWKQDFILKTARFGYDGKGQRKVSVNDNPQNVWEELGGAALIAERMVNFSSEFSMIIARDKLGQIVFYGPMENEHRNGILHKTFMPPKSDLYTEEVALKAKKNIQLLAEAVDLVGVMTLEFFLQGNGDILANEIAPRTHNSGHWSIDACITSQFDNHVRAVCGLNIGAPNQHSKAEMLNLIGADAERAAQYLQDQSACLHLYGKHDIRPGRKMGHVTFLKP